MAPEEDWSFQSRSTRNSVICAAFHPASWQASCQSAGQLTSRPALKPGRPAAMARGLGGKWKFDRSISDCLSMMNDDATDLKRGEKERICHQHGEVETHLAVVRTYPSLRELQLAPKAAMMRPRHQARGKRAVTRRGPAGGLRSGNYPSLT